MSTENEGAGPGGEYGEPQPGQYGAEEYGAEPTVQFDAFRARRADERSQQETQSGYVFPEEYAADPNTVFPQQPPMPPGPPFGGYGPEAGPGGAPGGRHKWRSMAIFGGAVVVAAALGVGVWAAFDSGSPSTGNTAAGSTATSTASPGATGKHDKSGALTFRVTIASIGADSFTGTVLANGDEVTVKLTSKTKFGTKAHPFAEADLSVGETVIVRGRRTGADEVTAGTVAANTTASGSPTATPSSAV
jgi:hypothetical protein